VLLDEESWPRPWADHLLEHHRGARRDTVTEERRIRRRRRRVHATGAGNTVGGPMSDGDFTVFLVDDDAGVLKALSRVLRSRGYEVRPYASPQAFLADHDPAAPGCAVFDVAMPGLDGLALQHALTADGTQRPVIFITGRGDVPTSVRAMKAGAVDFLTKPVSDTDLVQAIVRARAQDAKAREERAQMAAIAEKLARLTPREREVLAHVVAGRL